MKEAFSDVEKKLKQFMETGEDSHFGSAINNLHYLLINAYPVIPAVKHALLELETYSNKFYVANNDEKQKYYMLSLQRLSALKVKAESAGAL